ncbi:MAG: hypothetical protein NVS3B26_29560 [Mycobacteriales bacterium]
MANVRGVRLTSRPRKVAWTWRGFAHARMALPAARGEPLTGPPRHLVQAHDVERVEGVQVHHRLRPGVQVGGHRRRSFAQAAVGHGQPAELYSAQAELVVAAAAVQPLEPHQLVKDSVQC